MKCVAFGGRPLPEAPHHGGRGRLRGSEKDSEGPPLSPTREGVLGGGVAYTPPSPGSACRPSPGQKGLVQTAPTYPPIPPLTRPSACPPPIHPLTIHHLPSFSPSTRPSKADGHLLSSVNFLQGLQCGRALREAGPGRGNAQRACDLSWGLLSSRGALGHVWPRARRLQVSL